MSGQHLKRGQSRLDCIWTMCLTCFVYFGHECSARASSLTYWPDSGCVLNFTICFSLFWSRSSDFRSVLFSTHMRPIKLAANALMLRSGRHVEQLESRLPLQNIFYCFTSRSKLSHEIVRDTCRTLIDVQRRDRHGHDHSSPFVTIWTFPLHISQPFSYLDIFDLLSLSFSRSRTSKQDSNSNNDRVKNPNTGRWSSKSQ